MKKTDIKIFFILLIFSLLIFFEYLKGHFAADTFNIINLGYENYAIKYSLLDGRVFMALIGLFANKIQMPIILFAIITNVLAIIVSCISVVVLKNIVLSYKIMDKKVHNILVIIICYYTIFNFTYFENMYFVECFVMSISILLSILAAKKIVENSRKGYVKAIILIILSLMAYQGTISAFFIFVLLFSMLKQDNNYKTMIKNLIVSVGIFFIGFIFDNMCIILTEKYFNIIQTRGFSLAQLPENIIFIITNINRVIINTCNLFPRYLYISLLIMIEVLVFIKLIKQNKIGYSKKSEITLLEQFVLVIFCIVCAFIPSVMNLTGFWAARMRFSLGAMIGILFIHLIIKTNIVERKNIIDKVLIAIFIVYGVINSINYIYLTYLNKQVNEIDEKIVYEIDEYISEYEKKNNIKVENISIILCEGNVEKAYYPEMNCTNIGTAVSALRTQWASQGIINYYTNRNLKEKNVTKEEKNKYLYSVDKIKDYLCMGNTLYISVYMY